MPLEEETYRQLVTTQLENIESKIDMLDGKVSYTNGKVRKIIICGVLLAGVVIGQTFGNWKDIITLLAGMQ